MRKSRKASVVGEAQTRVRVEGHEARNWGRGCIRRPVVALSGVGGCCRDSHRPGKTQLEAPTPEGVARGKEGISQEGWLKAE